MGPGRWPTAVSRAMAGSRKPDRACRAAQSALRTGSGPDKRHHAINKAFKFAGPMPIDDAPLENKPRNLEFRNAAPSAVPPGQFLLEC
jgi:hypothetical protein